MHARGACQSPQLRRCPQDQHREREDAGDGRMMMVVGNTCRGLQELLLHAWGHCGLHCRQQNALHCRQQNALQSVLQSAPNWCRTAAVEADKSWSWHNGRQRMQCRVMGQSVGCQGGLLEMMASGGLSGKHAGPRLPVQHMSMIPSGHTHRQCEGGWKHQGTGRSRDLRALLDRCQERLQQRRPRVAPQALQQSFSSLDVG